MRGLGFLVYNGYWEILGGADSLLVTSVPGSALREV